MSHIYHTALLRNPAAASMTPHGVRFIGEGGVGDRLEFGCWQPIVPLGGDSTSKAPLYLWISVNSMIKADMQKEF